MGGSGVRNFIIALREARVHAGLSAHVGHMNLNML